LPRTCCSGLLLRCRASLTEIGMFTGLSAHNRFCSTLRQFDLKHDRLCESSFFSDLYLHVWEFSLVSQSPRIFCTASSLVLRAGSLIYRNLCSKRAEGQNNVISYSHSRSQWPHGLTHDLPSPAQTLVSWVQIPLKAWMFMCFYSVFVPFYVHVAALRWADPPSKESCRLCNKIRKLKKWPRSNKGL
jgi:hypothetical protein